VIPVGSFLGGVLGSHFELRPTLWIAAAGQMIAFLFPLFSPMRTLSRAPVPANA
jgi:predicted MFS family arabinose efflux permease